MLRNLDRRRKRRGICQRTNINSDIEIFPNEQVSLGIFRNSVASHQLALPETSVLHHGFYHAERVVFQMIDDIYMTNAIMLIRGVEDSLAKKALEAEALLREQCVMWHELPIHVTRHPTKNR